MHRGAGGTGPRAAGRRRRDEPQRTCVGCRRVAGQSQLLRVARSADGSLRPGRWEPGRGAWLCRGSVECLDEAVRRRAFLRALGIEPRREEFEAIRARLWGDRRERATSDEGDG